MPNGSGPPLQPPPNVPPTDDIAEHAIIAKMRNPVQSHAPLQIAQLLRNARRLGDVSEERMTSATMSEMNGAIKTAPTAAPVAHDGNGSSTGSGHRDAGGELTGVGLD